MPDVCEPDPGQENASDACLVVFSRQEGAMMQAFICMHGLLAEVRAGCDTEGTVWKALSPVCRATRRGRA